ncbi:MAG: hypothetical protein ACO2OR_04815, partial [Desulfurococcaceae archaeon]
MKKLLALGLLFLVLVVSLYIQNYSIGQAGRTIVIAVDLAHGENEKYLGHIQGNITSVAINGVVYPIQWVNISQGATITSDLLANVDILLIGQPT